ncbi:hypothetical protein BFP72_17410 [Reichenbachiella sp. 5M10]|nr:hypothetical protein BFP72_17410 [Reichenbachiella sp. 5M10]
MLSIILSCIFFLGSDPKSDLPDPCEIYGKVYFSPDPRQADFSVYVEETESFADVIVFEEANALYADRAGHWSTVPNRGMADVYIYLERNRSLADFSIYYTDYESFAGCNR